MRLSSRADVKQLAALGLACCALSIDGDASALLAMDLPETTTSAGLLTTVWPWLPEELAPRIRALLARVRPSVTDQELANRMDEILGVTE